EESNVEEESIRSFRLRQVDGIVVNPTMHNETFFSELNEQNFPVVFVNRRFPNIDARCVLMDNVKGASIAVEHLLKLQKKKIAIFLYDSKHIPTWSDRLLGYKTTLLKNGYNQNDFIIQYIAREKGSAKKMLIDFLRKND